ncbi:MAG: DUF1552 domain-containing protein [Pedosphaera sp.]|nr:DUF1552 domain-containing protein [Pedosphaera sp.]MSU43387.1 DUF1552 domain-containing protein [Pedosphaera sp.]
MIKTWQLPRRTFLRGLGTAMALPMLEAMLPARALAAGSAKFPTRMAFIYIPNGVVQNQWTPKQEGDSFQLPRILEPLAAHKDDLLVMSGLAHDKARANGDGPGDHARANATFLTGCQARKTSGSNIRAGVSVDQVCVQQMKEKTRLPSLELSSDGPRMSGNCDSGYSCAYQFNLAWRNDTTPLPPESNPALVFERMFSNGNKPQEDESRKRRREQQKSLLDFVREDAQQLEKKLGYTDKRKLDEYLTAIREMELRLEVMAKSPVQLPSGYSVPTGKPKDFGDHARLMFDMMALAFQTDSTRVASYLLAHDGDNRSYPHLSVREGHHSLSHHRNSPEKLEMLARINRYHCTLLAHFLERLKTIKEGDGTLLDHTMIVYGGAIGDGDRHSHHDLPVIVAGKANGNIRTGRHVRYSKDTPMSNLFLSMLDIMGTPTQRLGDSTGLLKELS